MESEREKESKSKGDPAAAADPPPFFRLLPPLFRL